MQSQPLPTFPNFTALEPHHQPVINQFIAAHPPYSDFNFISLWSWDHAQTVRISQLNNNLVIRFQDYTDPDDFFYSFLGSSGVDETAMILLNKARQEGSDKLKLIPEAVIQHIKNPEKFVINEDRDSFDYIIATKPEGGGHQPKRREVHRFLKQHAEHLTVSEIDISSRQNAEAILKVFEDWRAGINTASRFNQSEWEAVKKLVNHSHTIDKANLHVVGLYMGGELSAFAIAEILKDGYAMGHYAKTNKKYPRLGAALDHFLHESLAGKGVSHMNYEQDLGIEGLRQSKLSKQPVLFLKKYTIGLK